MVDNLDDEMIMPAAAALIGALAVVVFYWIHNAAVNGQDVQMISDTGVEITLFIAAFLSQYIPLKILEDRLDLKEHY